jgi:hypothetical protein
MNNRMGLILAVFMAAHIAWAAGADTFKLKNGDRVVFYGDSITDQRQYSVLVETFVATRYPHLDVTFVNSGWGGDSVAGGGAQTSATDVQIHWPRGIVRTLKNVEADRLLTVDEPNSVESRRSQGSQN